MPGTSFIHPSSVIEPGAQVGAGVRIGPFCHIGPDVVLGDGVEIVSHVSILGATTVGQGTKVFPQTSLGGLPQNTSHKGGRTTLKIGRNCTIRENVTMNCGTDSSRGETIIGDNGNFLAYVHIAHDCIVGNNVTFANCATLAGHCEVGDGVIIGGLTALLQFVRVGNYAFVGGCSAVAGDVVPYGIVRGNLAKLRGLNVVGMKRAGMARSDIGTLRKAHALIFDRSHPLAENLQRARTEFAGSALVEQLIAFMEGREKRYFCLPPVGGAGDAASDDEA